MQDQCGINSGENAKKIFQNVQDNVKQSEITHFNTMSIKPYETAGSFIDRIIEQAKKRGGGIRHLKNDQSKRRSSFQVPTIGSQSGNAK
jgi:hypothetical protein